MDELEFRRQAVVDPHDTREEFADMEIGRAHV